MAKRVAFLKFTFFKSRKHYTMRIYVFLLSILFFTSFSGLTQQKQLFEVGFTQDGDAKATYEEVKKLIGANYYYDGLSEDDLYWASIEGILRHISPPDNPDLGKLWTDKEYERILNSLKGVKVSMGFNSSFNSADGSLTVTKLTANSEAAQILKKLDRIVRIDNIPLAGKNITEINGLLDGEVGKSSTLKVVRDIDIFEVTLSREELKTENLIVTNIPNQPIALIEIKSISLGIAEELEAELIKLKAANINSIILDVRNNLGGVLNEGVNIAKLFMKKGNIVLRTQARDKGVTRYSAAEDKYPDFKIALLINENTASSSEIITSALQDHKRATIIGKKTFGKGVIETTYTLENQYRLKFITNAMYSPKGISWQSKGLLPDFFIDQSANVYKSVSEMDISTRLKSDLHLSTAIKILTQ